MAFRQWLRSLRRTKPALPEPVYLSELQFTELAPDVLRTLHGRDDGEVERPLVVVISSGETYQLATAYEFYVRTGGNPREVLSAYFALAHSAKDIPTSTHFLAPVVQTTRWLDASKMASNVALPSTRISSHLVALLAFECDGSMRYATQTDIDLLDLEVGAAMKIAVPNALSSRYALQQVGTNDGPAIWRVRSAVGSPVRALLGGPRFIVALTTKLGLRDPLVLVSGANDVFIADFVDLGADDALLRAARPFGTLPPPAALGSVLLTAGPDDDWHELPSNSPDYFSLLGNDWNKSYPDATVVYPVPKHDRAGHCAYIAEWTLAPRHFVLPAAADLLMVSRPDASKGWHTLPRRHSDVLKALGDAATFEQYPTHHWVVKVDRPERMFRALEKLPLHVPFAPVAED